MIIITPKVRIVGRQTIDYHEIDTFIRENTDKKRWETTAITGAEQLVEMSGRLCYMSYGKGRKTNEEYIDNIRESKHGSVLEHSVWNFIISGVSRSFTHELVRHRAGWGFSQLSQRYVNESEANFIVPKVIQNNKEAREVWGAAINDAVEAYQVIMELLRTGEGNNTLDIKTRRGAARSVLPNATETMIFCTANARAIRHFIEMRATPYADAEIRAVAIQLLRLMQTGAPNIFKDYKIITLEDGSEVAETDTIKV